MWRVIPLSPSRARIRARVVPIGGNPPHPPHCRHAGDGADRPWLAERCRPRSECDLRHEQPVTPTGRRGRWRAGSTSARSRPSPSRSRRRGFRRYHDQPVSRVHRPRAQRRPHWSSLTPLRRRLARGRRTGPGPSRPCPSTDGTGAILALDLGTTTGWAVRTFDGLITSGTVCFRPGRFDGGGMRYLRFTNWLTEIDRLSGPIGAIYFEEVRRHAGTDAAHIYGGLMATLTAWAELRGVPYAGRAGRHHQASRDRQGQRAEAGDDRGSPRPWLLARRRQRGRRPRHPALGSGDPRRCPMSARQILEHAAGRRGRSAARPTARPTPSWRRSPPAGR